MANLFCSSCGSKIQYTVKKPNFCTGCGEKLSSLANANIKAPNNEAEEEEVEAQQELPFERPDSLAYTLEGATKDTAKVSIKTLTENPVNPDQIVYRDNPVGETPDFNKYFKESTLKCASVKENHNAVEIKG